ncbi:hypothetical protein BHU72_05440 [Desulfuribacillus stibiiarsenatis]|uniref:Cytochrome c domain-containing protein n=1 Tax=Desulfuribacillus stibiiarsenatis TaxID=1390249 RepID=A0A1E5L4R6_9FIRM|nr:hypothetical protein [Desulfuribacillus stibiiarsenatis]OEH85054.1 hypothetical protein BHU72_05440 [Desulfuribacillus stibiiarsenatis]
MEFPVFELQYFGSNTLIAVIAIIHVIISHGCAVGGSIYLASTEYLAYKRKDEQLDQFARKFLKVLFIITTSVGALTGVGIWFAVSLGQPMAIASLLRVFFWAWFAEWIVFMTEIALLVIYFFTWKTIYEKGKALHVKIGIAYAVASWFTMVIITGVLAAMLTPGEWLVSRSFWDAFMNPTWIPSLLFRTSVAVSLISGFALLYASLTIKDAQFKQKIISYTGKWLLVSTLTIPPTGMFYLSRVPERAKDLLVWASGFINENTFVLLNTVGALVIFLIALWAIFQGKRFPAILSLVVLVLSVFYIGEMEMVREKIRKPYMIYGYMYANGVTIDDIDHLNTVGVLSSSKWSTVKEVTATNQLQAGREVFKLQCSSCHTINGWNSRRDIVQITNGWPEGAINAYIANLDSFHYFMPPFFGLPEEREALSKWIYNFQTNSSNSSLNTSFVGERKVAVNE